MNLEVEAYEGELTKLRKQMKEAAKKMEFELATRLREKINIIQKERL